MQEPPEGLRAGLEELLAGVPAARLSRAVDALIARYRRDAAAPEAILDSDLAVRAYAAYRMPATYAAVRAALGAFARQADGFRPRTLVDVGGGTGAAVWAAADVWGAPESAVVLERSPEAAAVGRALAAHGLPGAEWRRFLVGDGGGAAGDGAGTGGGGGVAGDGPSLPEADLMTACYLLGEVPEASRAALVRAMAARGGAVVLVEPGTPAGYRRIIAARALLLDAGMTVAAPCPHGSTCWFSRPGAPPPEERGGDWCHFAARLNRTALHRRLKGAELGHEDEKFSYVAASRTPYRPAAGRVLRHPARRKGLVELTVCEPDGPVDRRTVSKRTRETYRAAKDLTWGSPTDPIEPVPAPEG